MKRVLLLFIGALLAISATAQQLGKVNIKILDKASNQPVIGAVLEVYLTAKNSDKRYYTTNVDGEATIPALKYGNYTMLATCMGYADLTTTFVVNSSTQNLPTLKMKEKATRIETVVTSVKSLRASQHGDTLSYNAGAFKVTADADVEGLLKKMPGITINNGSVEAQGETVQKVFVDGKEFFGEDVSAAIKSLPAEAVDRIEVFNKLSDQAEFSGMDDGEGYKAINIVTKENMRQGQFGKMYAGYGYQPETDNATSKHKYTVGGNVNFFQKDSRISLIALFNNINQQNFSFEDILGVTGSTGGGGRRGFGQYMVRPQNGVALVNSIGLNYSDTWGRKDQVKFQGSYFFNNTNTRNISEQETWYEYPSPEDILHKYGNSETTNNNHRLNIRLDWKISRNQSLMSRTSFSFQGYDPVSTNEGYQYGDSGLLYLNDYNKTNRYGVNLFEFLQYRVKLGKPGRTLTVDGRISYRDNHSTRRISSNEASAIDPYTSEWDEYFGDGKDWHDMINNPLLYSPVHQYISAPTREYQLRGSLTYNEPISTNSQFSFQYRVSYEDEDKDQKAFYTDADFSDANRQINQPMTTHNTSGYMVHRLGPGFRYSKNKNTIIANVYYQRSSLEGDIIGGQSDKIARTFNDFTYFAMLNYAFNKENSIRVFFRSYTDAPSVTQLQSIFDVSSPQYLSIGNTDLKPAFSHRINFHYVHSNIAKGRTFMWMFSMQNQQDYISASTLYCPVGFELNSFGNVEIPKNSSGDYYKPQRITSYENMSGYWNLRTHISLGLPLSFMKCNLNIRAGVNYSIIPTAIYKSAADMVNHIYEQNFAKNIGYDASVTLGSNISENIDFTLSWDGTYSQAWNTAAAKNNAGINKKNNYFSHTATGTIKWVFWKGFTFTASCSYVQNLGFTDDYDENYLLCNLYLGKKLFRNQRGEIQIGVNDVANQNTSFIRSTGSGYTQNLTNSAIGRYFSIQFVYNLRHFGKRGSKQMKDYDYKESSNNVGMGQSNTRRSFGPMRR